jgi:hypothetical protein
MTKPISAIAHSTRPCIHWLAKLDNKTPPSGGVLDLVQRHTMRRAAGGKAVELLIINRCLDLHHPKYGMEQIVMR